MIGRSLFGNDVASTSQAEVQTSTTAINRVLNAGHVDDLIDNSEEDFSDSDAVKKLIQRYVNELPFVSQAPRAIPFCRSELVNVRNNATVTVCATQELPQLIKARNVVLRYALTEQNEMRYGAEATPGKRTPAHVQLISRDSAVSRQNIRCLAAGNIIIKDGKLVAITNKSGDFRPDVQSMQFALAAMLREGIAFGNEITIEQHLFDANDYYAGMYEYKVTIECLKKALIDLGLSITPETVVKTEAMAAGSDLKRKEPSDVSAPENLRPNPSARRRL